MSAVIADLIGNEQLSRKFKYYEEFVYDSVTLAKSIFLRGVVTVARLYSNSSSDVR